MAGSSFGHIACCPETGRQALEHCRALRRHCEQASLWPILVHRRLPSRHCLHAFATFIHDVARDVGCGWKGSTLVEV